ncbi:MAG: chromosomal replication initiator protein DnaA [Oscillospiraceae bacterium]|jgi:chromosomal replication initiator protein|nr:chromosomal replication initiator protein DnaA [Oscillospiraceae bacterium]
MESYVELWEIVREYCKSHVTETVYNLWLAPLQLVSFEDNKVTLSVSEFKKNIIENKFFNLLNDAFEDTLGFKIEIEIVILDATNFESKKEKKKKVEDIFNKYDFTFDTFIVGSSNTFAFAAAQAVAETPGHTYNPLFIYGHSGLGKTHLLNAILYKMKSDNENSKIIYTSGEDFTNELISSIQNRTMSDFHNKYRTVDALLVDDVQFIGGKIQTEEEFFHTFNTLAQSNKQIVLTSDRPPKEIQTLEDRIRTRFESGLLADIQPPDIETRMAIIKRKADLLNLELQDDVIQYMGDKIKNNIRQLEGAVKKLNAYYTIGGHPPSIILAQKAIKDISSSEQPVSVTIEKILNEIARTYGTTIENIRSDKRNSNISKARQSAMYIIREITPLSMEQIGSEFGNKHHSTVIYNIREAEKNIKNNPSVKATIQDIINNVREK